jgi:hypothetical protein
MRIIVAGPPKTGNIWITCLLSEIYTLNTLYRPPATDVEFDRAVRDGWFPDGSIFHQHYSPSPVFLKTAAALDCNLVTIIRNPYDTFVSLYFFVQNFPGQFSNPQNPLSRICKKPLDHPDIFGFLRDVKRGYGIHLKSALDWMKSSRSVILRYESLKSEPAQVLAEVTARIQPVEEAAIRRSIEACNMENMRKMVDTYGKHIRKGAVGDWRNHLGTAHLDAINTHRGWIEALGYEIHKPEETR